MDAVTTAFTLKDYGLIGLALAILLPVVAFLYKEGKNEAAGRLTDQKELTKVIKSANDVLSELTASTNARTESANKATDAQIAAMQLSARTVEAIAPLAGKIDQLETEIRRFRDYMISKGMPI